MRFMILVKASAESEAGVMPPESLITAMADYHEALAKAGVLVDADGLQPTSKGWRSTPMPREPKQRATRSNGSR